MNVAIRSYTRSGHTEKLAKAIAGDLQKAALFAERVVKEDE